MSRPVIYLGMPCGSRRIDVGAARALFYTPCRAEAPFDCVPDFACGTLLTHVFNTLWVRALRGRKANGFTHFAMIHSDVDPSAWWLETLFAEMASTGADVVSTVIPIKDGRGLTSTGGIHRIAPGDSLVRRLTLHECYQLPETFGLTNLPWDADALAVNTGLWLCDLRKDWAEKVCFRQEDVVVKKTIPGRDEPTFFANSSPEDWNFSLDLADWGAKVVATRKVSVRHFGDGSFDNSDRGVWDTDREFEAIAANGYAVA